jgi:hypothetical protein
VRHAKLAPNDSSGKIHKKPIRKNWMIRMQSLEYLDWKVHRSDHMFIFDGASKNNTWVAGARGIIHIVKEMK